ncbi:MAG: FAD-dependent oxidoreductase [Coriobacteriales bacterium]|jgi:NADPH-dependent glutamate synthase beta subunit-like oxidoreductase|nr:FAD-dependent oxidoreductase [Coriobacteriales bacterium]
MTRINVYHKSPDQTLAEDIRRSLQSRLATAAISCPVEFAAAAVRVAGSESCGKCTPCRVGLAQLALLYDALLDGKAAPDAIARIDELSEHIYRASDCAIGFEAGALSLQAVRGFQDEFRFHLEKHDCSEWACDPVPCRSGCPADVDVPAYLALVAAGRYTDAVRVVRKDNPLAIICGLICEHPCESYCRRGLVDAPVNIRGIKRYAAEHMEEDYAPAKAEPTGKRVAIVGGGPAGLSAAYYLALMGHSPVVYEQREQLGGMLRYGIPSYRLPHSELDREIAWLLGAGIEVRTGVAVGTDVGIDELKAKHDAVYLAIGAHAAVPLRVPGEDAQGVYSAVELLRRVGSGDYPNYSGKRVCVIGGGNVAMDAARTALRLGAATVRIVYRRRRLDMTAQPVEIDATIAEGCELRELVAPVRIEARDGQVAGLVLQPQMISVIKDGRASPKPASTPEQTLECDCVIIAVGQAINSAAFASYGLPVKRARLQAAPDGSLPGHDGLFSGGDCVTGPATVIRAVSAGKAAAASIDSYLGYNHRIELDVEVPPAFFSSRVYCARSNMTEPYPDDLVGNFVSVEVGLLPEEALQEASRCLRCDHFGSGALRGGRKTSW